jgi:hypothetical protein
MNNYEYYKCTTYHKCNSRLKIFHNGDLIKVTLHKNTVNMHSEKFKEKENQVTKPVVHHKDDAFSEVIDYNNIPQTNMVEDQDNIDNQSVRTISAIHIINIIIFLENYQYVTIEGYNYKRCNNNRYRCITTSCNSSTYSDNASSVGHSSKCRNKSQSNYSR